MYKITKSAQRIRLSESRAKQKGGESSVDRATSTKKQSLLNKTEEMIMIIRRKDNNGKTQEFCRQRHWRTF